MYFDLIRTSCISARIWLDFLILCRLQRWTAVEFILGLLRLCAEKLRHSYTGHDCDIDIGYARSFGKLLRDSHGDTIGMLQHLWDHSLHMLGNSVLKTLTALSVALVALVLLGVFLSFFGLQILPFLWNFTCPILFHCAWRLCTRAITVLRVSLSCSFSICEWPTILQRYPEASVAAQLFSDWVGLFSELQQQLQSFPFLAASAVVELATDRIEDLLRAVYAALGDQLRLLYYYGPRLPSIYGIQLGFWGLPFNFPLDHTKVI
eukprot:SAG31_NODE_3238_length_4507_cov_14.674682_4_plen_263_part_00